MLDGTSLDNAIDNAADTAATVSTGMDIAGTVNGVTATGSGNTLSVDSSTSA